MSEIVLREPLASQIQQAAESEGVDIERFIEDALRHYRFQAQRKKIETESAWWRAVPVEVRAVYAGEFVAIHQQTVIDHDSNEETLRKRIRTEYGKAAVLITPAAGQRVLKIVSTHLTRP